MKQRLPKDVKWTEEEWNTIQSIIEGLKLNGWHLNYISRRGKGWHFIIIPLEEVENEE